MQDIFQQIYDGIFKFKPLKKFLKSESNHRELFPVVGFLDAKRKKELEKALNIKIKNTQYFEQALIHRSYLQVLGRGDVHSNERMEFLGDAILGMLIAEYLFSMDMSIHEGDLTKLRARLVNKKSLTYCALDLRLNDFLMMSYSCRHSLDQGNDALLGDAMEAIIAAVYLDSGLRETNDFILNRLIPTLLNKSVLEDTNYKSKLLETVQANGKEAPSYSVLEANGPDHDKEFKIGVYVGGELLAVGIGKNKRAAEQNAAFTALEKLSNLFS